MHRWRTSIDVAPASSEFSISSLTHVARSSMTCPEQMRCTDALSMDLMLGCPVPAMAPDETPINSQVHQTPTVSCLPVPRRPWSAASVP